MKTQKKNKTKASAQDQPEGIQPGSGRVGKDSVDRSGTNLTSDSGSPSQQAKIQGQASWGQRESGIANYEKSGQAPVIPFGIEKPDPATFDMPATPIRQGPAKLESSHRGRGPKKAKTARNRRSGIVT